MRRWIARGAAAGCAVVGFALFAGGTPQAVATGDSSSALPVGAAATLRVGGALAAAPNRGVYVADLARHQVLVRLPDGKFRVVAGDGLAGYSGDGGPALRARLSNISALTSSSTGQLYLVDGSRVRLIEPGGTIRTIAGNGRSPRVDERIRSGTLARAAALGPDCSIAVDPTGGLYISTPWQLLRLTRSGKLENVRAIVRAGPLEGSLDKNLGPIGISSAGNLYVAGFNGWSVWDVTPAGTAREVRGAEARRNGGDFSTLERGPNGSVYGEGGSAILRIVDDKFIRTFNFARGVGDQRYFWLTYFAFGSDGEIYAEDMPRGPGDTAQQLVSVKHGKVTLLWQG